MNTSTISPSDPMVIIAGIRQFGLTPDGSDLRDLEAAFTRLHHMREECAKIVEKKIIPSDLPEGYQSGENLWLNEVEFILKKRAEKIRSLSAA